MRNLLTFCYKKKRMLRVEIKSFLFQEFNFHCYICINVIGRVERADNVISAYSVVGLNEMNFHKW
jgi:hypothetical protein